MQKSIFPLKRPVRYDDLKEMLEKDIHEKGLGFNTSVEQPYYAYNPDGCSIKACSLFKITAKSGNVNAGPIYVAGIIVTGNTDKIDSYTVLINKDYDEHLDIENKMRTMPNLSEHVNNGRGRYFAYQRA